MRRSALLLALVFSLFGSACAGNQAYLDWRPGLSEIDFEGLFEISLDEFDGFSAEAAPNTIFDRYHHHGDAQADVAAELQAIGELVAATASSDARGYAITSLAGDGSVSLTGDQGRTFTGAVDWFGATPDRRFAALVTGTKLAVAIDGASTGIDIGSLVGGSLGGYAVMMFARDEELTVFALPELGGAVTANEPGYLFSFRHQAGGREAWDISVARVIIQI